MREPLHPDDPTGDELRKLLRLKRFEQPAPEYFENFLREFQQRQRAQLLRESAWRIALDRLSAFFGAPHASSFGYGLATAAVLLLAGLASYQILTAPPEGRGAAPLVAQQPGVVVPEAQPARFTLNSNVELPDVTEAARRTAHSAWAMPPRYVMDRPVSYEPPSSF